MTSSKEKIEKRTRKTEKLKTKRKITISRLYLNFLSGPFGVEFEHSKYGARVLSIKKNIAANLQETKY